MARPGVRCNLKLEQIGVPAAFVNIAPQPGQDPQTLPYPGARWGSSGEYAWCNLISPAPERVALAYINRGPG